MGRILYEKGVYRVFSAYKGVIIHNTRYNFQDAHTHVSNLYVAKRIIYHIRHQVIPMKFTDWDLQSMLRICDDPDFRELLHAVVALRKKEREK